MSKQTEALKQALEALEEIESYYGYDRSVGAMASSMYEASNLAKITSTRIREALAEQPAQRKPLSMQERTSIVRANKSFHDKDEIDAYGIIDDVEAAHGIKGDA